ncbi:hypothetical protein CSHISOI_08060 [Colletotrichum shisoi]|uniref:Uncharacterized protein n=1 Tax=Colletotrichum shisoi TaxID=2078593 RepID=A0A5Q4BL49_9PEZI|nr:hypothetical protein CSHISOI_08060 [Colletotrichum shisoi]
MMNDVEAMVTDTRTLPCCIPPLPWVLAFIRANVQRCLPSQVGKRYVLEQGAGPVRARSCLHPPVRIDFFPLLWASLGPLAPRFVPPFHTSPHLLGAHRLLTLQKADYTSLAQPSPCPA